MQHHSPAFLLTSDLRERWVPTRSELVRQNKKRLRSPFVLPSSFNIIIMIDQQYRPVALQQPLPDQEDDLKPEFKLKVAEWEVRKALAGHSNKVQLIIIMD